VAAKYNFEPRQGNFLFKRTRRQFMKTTATSLDFAAEPAIHPIPTERAKALMAAFGLKYPIF